MHAQIDERAAAGAGFVAEPAARVAVAAQIGGLRVVKLAKEVLLHEIAQQSGAFFKAPHKAHHEQLAGLFGGFLHLNGLCCGKCHRLFAEHVLAGFQRGNGARRVGGVPGAHAHGVDLRHFPEHLRLVGEQALHAVFFTHHPHTVGVDIAKRDKLRVRVVQIRLNVVVGNISCANDGNFHFLHIFSRLSCGLCRALRAAQACLFQIRSRRNDTARAMSSSGLSPTSRSIVRKPW